MAGTIRARLPDRQPPHTAPPLSVPSVDVFLTYRCGLRCAHCFVGDNLATKTDFPFPLLERLMAAAHEWDTREITFLGGEPTLYPRLADALELARLSGYRTRLVTNGHRACARFLRDHRDGPLPDFSFSLDGASPATHDRIRGRGSFSALMESVAAARARGATIGGILSISRDNADDVPSTLRLCDELGFEHLTIHYVTNRGFARQESVLSVQEWRQVCSTIEAVAPTLQVRIRFERTFHTGMGALRCAVRDRNNLMFLPDGRVYMCMMFIDIPGSHSFTWTADGLVPNRSACSEQHVVATTDERGCPAIGLVNRGLRTDADRHGTVIGCMYDKETAPSR